jgi:hypothetical protein
MIRFWILNIFLIASSFNILDGQNYFSWSWGSKQSDAVSDLKGSSKYIIVSGHYEDSFDWNKHLISHYGQDDIYLAALDLFGNPVWVEFGGGSRDERASGIAINTLNQIAFAGSYWEKAQFSSFQLASESHPKECFITLFTEDGNLIWLRKIMGTSIKEISSIVFLTNQNLCVTGYFSDSLIVENEILTAKGGIDGFFACYNSSGNLMNVGNFGGSGNVFAKKILAGDSNSIIIAGNYDGAILLEKDSIFANTRDDDIFILKLNETGKPNWLKKAGGVHSDMLNTATLSPTGIILLGGTFVGNLTIDNTLTISSDDGFGDAFLIGLSQDGIPLWAQKFGGPNFQTIRTLDANYASGLYSGNLQLGEALNFTSTLQNFQFFSLEYDPSNGAIIEADVFENQGTFFPNSMSFNRGLLYTGGSFSEGFFGIPGSGNFDALVFGKDNTVNLVNPHFDIFDITVFPNPTSESIYWTTKENIIQCLITDITGKSIYHANPQNSIDIKELSPGIYWITFINELNLKKSIQFVKH